VLPSALIDAFIAPTQQTQVGLLAEFLGNHLIEKSPLRREQMTGQVGGVPSTLPRRRKSARFITIRPAAKWFVVSDVMAIARPITDIMEMNLDQAALAGPLQDAGAGKVLRHPGKG
jgi:hypothetical protein